MLLNYPFHLIRPFSCAFYVELKLYLIAEKCVLLPCLKRGRLGREGRSVHMRDYSF